MLKQKEYKFWFCTGSQDLYGDECLAHVAEHSKIIVEKLNESGLLPYEVVWKPTLITNVTNDMRVAQEEIFGPVACVIKFKNEEDVIAMANDSEYGLGGAVWTKDINRAIRISQAIETGRMWVNTYNQIPAGAPFGGYKKSGIGRETHKVILEHYTQQKNIMINLNEAPSGFYPA